MEPQHGGILSDCSRVDLERAACDIEHIVGCSAIQWWRDSLSVEVSVGRGLVEIGDSTETLLERAQPTCEKKLEQQSTRETKQSCLPLSES